MPLVERKELMFGRRGMIARLGARLLMHLPGVGKANRLYDRVADLPPERCAGEILRLTGTGYRIEPDDLARIPAEGPLVIVSNHPTGALDGIVLIDALTKVRPDVRFMGNYLLSRIRPLAPYFIAVDPFDGASAVANAAGLREALRHVAGGGALAIFPAGEVSTIQKGKKGIRDKAWGTTVLRMIRRMGVPVLPLHIDARNSRLFHAAGRIHPALRTALLPHELFNKRGAILTVAVGSVVDPRLVAELDEERYGNYLRLSSDCLAGTRGGDRSAACRSGEADRRIVPALDPARLRAELDALPRECLLFEYNRQAVYCIPPGVAPCMMQEIGRQREIAFRRVGEGTMHEVDTDRYDTYYHQLLVWDRAVQALVGGYRLGLGGEIMPRMGREGFYTHALFRYDERIDPLLTRTVELGRSFVANGYQRRPVSLMLLWKGILYVLLRHTQYRYLLGPVTISGTFHVNAKAALVDFLAQNHFDAQLAAAVYPVTGLDGIESSAEASLWRGIGSVELAGRIVSDIERGRRTMPVLIRKYLQLNSRVLGFNVDHDFCDGLDALMLLDLQRVPRPVIDMLSKEIAGADVAARFAADDGRDR